MKIENHPGLFQKGVSRHPKAGRRKGVLNRKTVFLGQTLEQMKFYPVEKLKACLEKLERITPRHAGDEIQMVKVEADIYSYFFNFLYPKMNPVDVVTENPWGEMPTDQKLVALEQYKIALEKQKESEEDPIEG